MRKDNALFRLLALLAVSAALMTTAALAFEAGSAQDPLVTLSYLNETFLDSVLQQVDQRIAQGGGGGASAPSGSASAFTVVTLTQGQVLTGDIGCEVLLRVGSAACVSPSSPGLIDETSGSVLENGKALSQNHLYMMTIEGRGVQATAATVKVMARGSYFIT